ERSNLRSNEARTAEAIDHPSNPREATTREPASHTSHSIPEATPRRIPATPTAAVHRCSEVVLPGGAGAAAQVIVNIWLAPEMARKTDPARNEWRGPHQEPPRTRTAMAQPAATAPNTPASRKAARASVCDSTTRRLRSGLMARG